MAGPFAAASRGNLPGPAPIDKRDAATDRAIVANGLLRGAAMG